MIKMNNKKNKISIFKLLKQLKGKEEKYFKLIENRDKIKIYLDDEIYNGSDENVLRLTEVYETTKENIKTVSRDIIKLKNEMKLLNGNKSVINESKNKDDEILKKAKLALLSEDIEEMDDFDVDIQDVKDIHYPDYYEWNFIINTQSENIIMFITEKLKEGLKADENHIDISLKSADYQGVLIPSTEFIISYPKSSNIYTIFEKNPMIANKLIDLIVMEVKKEFKKHRIEIDKRNGYMSVNKPT